MSKINFKKSNCIIFIYTLLLLSSISCGNEPSSSSPMTTPSTTNPTPSFQLPEIENKGYDFSSSNEEGWEMIWEDNFNSDLSDWSIWSGGAFNNELQHYQASNLFVENDFLYIRQRRGNVRGRTNPFDETQKNFRFSSGRIETKTAYGPLAVGGSLRYAARIKLPAGEGLWPAFWSYDNPWPTQGEIDVIEFRGGKTNTYSTNFFFGTQPNQVLTNSTIQTKHHESSTPLTDEFHVFELEWTRDQLMMKLDGNTVQVYDSDEFQYVDDLFGKMQRITLNLAVGGDFFNNLDERQIPSESYLIVDWVKVYKKS